VFTSQKKVQYLASVVSFWWHITLESASVCEPLYAGCNSTVYPGVSGLSR
jgi:hypothetical protein